MSGLGVFEDIGDTVGGVVGVEVDEGSSNFEGGEHGGGHGGGVFDEQGEAAGVGGALLEVVGDGIGLAF
ncbi:MAG: hypothetical protein RI897_1482 [Verrucomicrobiota bacterium]